jgi:glucans biosynthesis protein
MTFRPGEATIVDVETTLFPRVNLEHVGLGGMGSTFLFGPNVRRTTDDLRPAVYDAAGLQMFNGRGEWLWRPLNNPDTLQISAFVDENPRGFGLIQRERDAGHFQDDAQQPERRPSVWIEPIGEWAQGACNSSRSLRFRGERQHTAYWRPRAPMQAGSEVAFAYRQFWGWTPPRAAGPGGSRVDPVGRGASGRRRRFLVEFAGESLAAPVPDLRPALSTASGAVQNVRLWAYPDRKVARVAFELDPRRGKRV